MARRIVGKRLVTSPPTEYMNDLNRDVLMEDLARFEDGVFQKTLSTARRVRRTRLAVRYGTPVVLALCIAAMLWFPRSPDTVIVSAPPNGTMKSAVVESNSRLVIFRSKEFAGVIRTQPLRADQTLVSPERAFVTMRTVDTHPKIDRINDNQLLAFFAGKTVALVGRGPNAKLIFPEDTATK